MNPTRLRRVAEKGSHLLVAALVTVMLGLMACATGIGPGAKPSAVSQEKAGLPSIPAAKPKRVSSRPAIAPSQLTARADPALGFAVSQDGSRLALTISGEGFASIWLQSADPGRVELPHRLAASGGDQYQPAFFPSGDQVVFVGTGHDVKGDLYLASAGGSRQEPRRLTGRETADRAPCVSPDGGRIYFHRSRPGKEEREIAVLAMEGSSPARVLDIPRDAAYPAISPDGSQCAFVSSSQQGDAIFVFDLQRERLTRLTGGGFRDAHPSWSPDGGYVVFSRCTPAGVCSIWQVRAEENKRDSHPLTSSAYSARQPSMGADRLFFLSDRSEVANIWYLPATGQIPPKGKAAEQMELAQKLEAFYPPDLHLAALGYRMVRQRFPEQQRLAAEAGLQAGLLYERLEQTRLAKAVYLELQQAGGVIQPHSGMAALRLEALQARRKWSDQVLDRARRQVLHQAEEKIAAVAAKAPNHPRLLVQSLITRAKLLIDLGGQSQDLLSALDLLDQGLGIEAASAEQQARALLIKADVFQRVGRSEAVIPLYASILEQYPDIRPWSERAVGRILDFQLAGENRPGMQGRIGVLRRIAERYRSRLPRLAMGAQNRIGDLYFEAGKWAKAKLVYRQVLEGFQAGSSTQHARARLALAEILYREERFAEALRLYESEMAARSSGDSLYRLAWQGYVRKNLEAAEHHFQLGEISRARTMFYDLMRQDPTLVQAHRGYIKSAATQGEIAALISAYRRAVAEDPGNPVLIYGLALSLTYRQGIDALLKSRDLLRKAIHHEGQIEFFHQTLGYVYEVLETAHGRRGQLELALEHYRKALFLNDSRQNPRNRANLLLNLGNASYLLGDYDQAFAFYRLRAESGADFQNKDTELVFYRRYGQAAFLTEKGKKPVEAFAKGLDVIEQRLDAKQASHILGKLHRSVKERILLPARKKGLEQGLVQTLFQRQSTIHSGLFRASRKAFGPPPDPGWTDYEGSVRPLLAEQKDLILDLEPLARRMSGLDWTGVKKGLLARLDLARQALDFPLELREMEAEMLDRLGLAFQEADAWSKARERYEQAFALNRELGNFRNLAPNRRSAGYNAYLQAGEATGRKRSELLELALSDFREVLDLVERYGVPEPKKTRRKTGLISISIDLALEEQTATQAQYGFNQDQEQRLARAFISRIQTELGRLEPAMKAAEEQLQAYPENKPLPDRDLFGVSLLLHRSAHLESAGGDPARACERFLRSARLALKMSSPVSSALNVVNAALSLSEAALEEDRKRALAAELVRLDKEAERLLAGNAEVLDALIPAGYHNRMGVAYAALATSRSREDVSAAAASLLDLTRAVSHFSRGLAGLKDTETRSRSALALEAALHLNLADLADREGARDTARAHFEKALSASKRGRLARFQWRSLAGLGRVEEAVRMLARVPLFERGCGPFEVLGRLRALVEDPEGKNAPARAFNILEELSEMERVQRMTPRALRAASLESLQEMRSLKERLLRLEELNKRVATAAGEDKAYLERRLEEENRLLEAALKREDAFSGSFLERFQSLERRNSFLFLAGLSAEMILAAKREVQQGEKEPRDDLQQAFLQAGDAFLRRMEEARALLGPEEPAGLLGLFVPAPVQAADVAASLPRGATAVRLAPGRTKEGGWLAFILDASGLERLHFEAKKPPFPEGQGPRILLFEAPFAVDFAFEGLHALSGTHLLRSVDAKKPFKRKVLIYPEGPDLAEAFEAMALHPPVEPLDIAGMSPRAHTVLFDAPVGARRTVPTRKGRLPEDYLGMELQDGRHMDLSLLSGRLENVSLVLLNQGLKDDLFALGHLFSLFGASTVLVPSEDPGSAEEIQAFFRRYADTSLLKARQGALASGSAPGASWLQLGYWGLGPEAAAELARQRFAAFVREGVEAYRSGRHSKALGLFENGLLVVYEIKQFSQYEAKLLKYARESAFAAGDLERAAHHAGELARHWAEHRPGSQVQAQALLKQGLVLARLERFDEAVPRLQQAVEILENLDLPLEQIQALSDLGTVLENATEYDRALQGFEAAASLSREVGGRELQARQAMHIGRIYDLRLSRYAMAKASYSKALEIFEDLGRERAAAQAQLDLARCNRLLGRFDATKDLLARSLQRVRNLSGAKRLQTKIVLEQANLAWFQARYQKAFTLQQQALKEARENDWLLEQVIALNTAGLTWWTLGKSERALRDLRRALEMARSLDIRRDEVATTYNNMGLVLREQKRFDQALEILQKALAIDREIGSRWAMAYDLRNIGLTHLHRGQPQQALPLLEKALSLSAEIGNAVNQAKSLLALGEAFLQLDRLDAARARFEEALTLSRGMALRETVWRALYGLGRIHELRDELEKARQRLMEAVEIVETLRTEIKITQLRDSFLADKMEAYEALVSVLLRMGREREAFSAAERSRSRNLIDLLGNQSLSLSGEREQELYERFASLQAAIEEQEKLAAQAEAEQDRQVYRETLQDLQDEARDLLRQIQAEHPELVSLVAVDTLSVQGVMERLDPGVTLLTYYLLPDGVVCWVLSAESFKTVQVPADRERLKELVLEFRRTLQNLEPYQAEARRLSELLVEPMRRELELAEHVGLVPHRSLHYLSFAALFLGDRPLVEARPLFTLPSASLLRYTLKRRVQGKSRQVLAVGNPALKDLQLELPFAEQEVRAIGWNFPAQTTLIGEEATESRLVESAPGFDVVHIASHGSYDPAHPMFSSIKLADDPQQDGDLKATEVFGLSLRADLVVLSACQSGLGEIREGDEVIGLNRAFMYAGAHAIISSLWRVSDISTAMLMKQFYREYVRRNKASSLRRAMLHTRRYYPHPGYWAGFLLLGDYL